MTNQKQPSRGVLMKRCSENMQQIYAHTSAWVFSCKFVANFQKNFFLRTPIGGCFCTTDE